MSNIYNKHYKVYRIFIWSRSKKAAASYEKQQKTVSCSQ